MTRILKPWICSFCARRNLGRDLTCASCERLRAVPPRKIPRVRVPRRKRAWWRFW